MDEMSLFEVLARRFEMGGWPMVPMTLLGGLLVPGMLAAVIVAAVARRSRGATLFASGGLVVGGLLVLAIAAAGWQAQSGELEMALALVNPEDAETIRAAGRSETLTLIVWGLSLSVCPLSLGVALSGLGLARFFGLPKSPTTAA